MKSEAKVIVKRAWLKEKMDDIDLALLNLMKKQAELDKKLHALLLMTAATEE